MSFKVEQLVALKEYQFGAFLKCVQMNDVHIDIYAAADTVANSYVDRLIINEDLKWFLDLSFKNEPARYAIVFSHWFRSDHIKRASWIPACMVEKKDLFNKKK